MDLKAKYLLETCSEPIGFLNQLRQTTEPIGGGTVYSEDGELVEYEVAVEAIKKANDAFIEKAREWLNKESESYVKTGGLGAYVTYEGLYVKELVEDFEKYMEGE